MTNFKRMKSEALWDEHAKILTELSKRDGVEYRVRSTEHSGSRKLNRIGNLDALEDI